MFTLFIANKNYSSWSLRPWVLMRELGLPFRESLVPFGGAENPDAQKLMNASQNAIELLPGEAKPFVLRLTRRPEDPTRRAARAGGDDRSR